MAFVVSGLLAAASLLETTEVRIMVCAKAIIDVKTNLDRGTWGAAICGGLQRFSEFYVQGAFQV